MGVGRLTDTTRSRELSNALHSIGLLSGESQGDRITKNVADLRPFLKQAKHGGNPKNNGSLAEFFLHGLNCPHSHTGFCVVSTGVTTSAAIAWTQTQKLQAIHNL